MAVVPGPGRTGILCSLDGIGMPGPGSAAPGRGAPSPEALSPEAVSPEALSPEALSPEAPSPGARGPGGSGAGALSQDPGRRAAEPVLVADLAAAIRDRERTGDVRWVWPSTAEIYPALLRAGVRVERCHDVALTEGLLLGRAGAAARAPAFSWPPRRRGCAGGLSRRRAPRCGPAGLRRCLTSRGRRVPVSPS